MNNYYTINTVFFFLVTFEDKRKENFDKGQAELDRRRALLQEQLKQEENARLEKERREAEKRERIRLVLHIFQFYVAIYMFALLFFLFFFVYCTLIIFVSFQYFFKKIYLLTKIFIFEYCFFSFSFFFLQFLK